MPGRSCAIAIAVAIAGCVAEAPLVPEPNPPDPPPAPAPCVATVERTLVATSDFYPRGLALDDDHIYFADYFTDLVIGGGHIYRTSKTSGDMTTTLYSMSGIRSFDLRGLTYRGGALFWREEGYFGGTFVERLRTMPATGGSPVTIAVGQHIDFVVDDDYTYLTRRVDYDVAVIERIPHGGAPEQLATLDDSIQQLAIDDTHLYGVSYLSGIWRMPKSGGSPDFVVPDDSAKLQVLLDAEHLYRFDRDNTISLTRFSKLGGAGHPIEVPPLRDPWYSALLDGDDFYLLGSGMLSRLPKLGGDYTPIACPTDGFEPHFMAADATRFYFFAQQRQSPDPGVWAVDRAALAPMR